MGKSGYDRGNGNLQIAGYAVAVLALLVAATQSPQPGDDVMVVVAPWKAANTAALVATMAGGTLIHAGRWPFIVVARPRLPVGAGVADRSFISNLYLQGAMIVLDAGSRNGCN